MKRRVLLIIVFLLLGALVNVAVALALSLVADLQRVNDPFGRTVESGGHWMGEPYFPWTVYSERQSYLRRVWSSYHRGLGGGGTGFPKGSPEPLIPAWAPHITPAHIPADETGAWDFLAWEVGWPRPSQGGVLSATRKNWQSPVQISLWWCLPLDSVSARDPNAYRDVRLLVFRPIWPGFIINTLFYALLLWLLFFAPFAARRMIRRRRGQCETCAYPIGVSPVCTECGAALPRRGRNPWKGCMCSALALKGRRSD